MVVPPEYERSVGLLLQIVCEVVPFLTTAIGFVPF